MAKAIANLEFGYDGSDFKRTYALELNDSIAAADRNNFVRSAVQAVNASLSAGTSGGLDDFFVAEDFDGTNGKFNGIIYADVTVDTDTVVYPANGGN